MEAGDVIIILQEKEHETFQRRNHNLYCVYNLGLTEALCGFEFTLKQLDGRDLVIKNPPGKVIEPGKLFTMPFLVKFNSIFACVVSRH